MCFCLVSIKCINVNQINDIDKFLPSYRFRAIRCTICRRFFLRIDHYRTAPAQAIRWAINYISRSLILLESVNSIFPFSKMGSMTFWSCLYLVFWLNMQSYLKWSVSLFSKACYTSKTETEISRFVIAEGRMILSRFLAANIPNISSTLPVK